jgi:hypothetical protein
MPARIVLWRAKSRDVNSETGTRGAVSLSRVPKMQSVAAGQQAGDPTCLRAAAAEKNFGVIHTSMN